MIDIFRRKALERKGMSCGKVRKRTSSKLFDNEIIQTDFFKISFFTLFLIFFVIIALKQDKILKTGIFTSFTNLGITENSLLDITQIISISIFILGSFFVYIKKIHTKIYEQSRILTFIFFAIALQILALYSLTNVITKFENSQSFVFFLVFPYYLSSMLVTIILGHKEGIMVTILTGLFCSLLLPIEMAFSFFMVIIISGFLVAITSHRVRRRKILVRSGFYAGLCSFLIYVIMGFMAHKIQTYEVTITGLMVALFISILVGLISAMIISGIVSFAEWLFGITSNISWIELSDLNQPLLRRLMLEAPGTYHHSLMVANLSEAAAESINCNSAMTRVCSYMHDIGKLKKPNYYIENQYESPNPHDELTPRMSAIVIKAHVKDGIDYAVRNGLPREVIDIITEHHGNTLIAYFYKKALDELELKEKQAKNNEINQEDVPIIDKKIFRHEGPIPQTKESAIISLADSIESASRTLSKPSPNKISNLINNIVKTRLEDNQLDDSDLTLTELKIIKKSFQETLLSTMHRRINYPEIANKIAEAEQEKEEHHSKPKEDIDYKLKKSKPSNNKKVSS